MELPNLSELTKRVPGMSKAANESHEILFLHLIKIVRMKGFGPFTTLGMSVLRVC